MGSDTTAFDDPSSSPSSTLDAIGPTSLLVKLPEDDFRITLAVFIFAGAFMLGIGLELFVGKLLIHHTRPSNAVAYYKLIVFAWPMLLNAGLLSFHVFGLFFATFGLFYGGTPMILYYVALGSDPTKKVLERTINWGKAMGSALHHGSFLLICSLIVAGQVVPTRNLVSLGLPLLLLHFAELLEYITPYLYYLVVIGSEVWFQCEIFATLPSQPGSMKVAFWFMILAHFLVLGASTVDIIVFRVLANSNDGDKSKPESAVHDNKPFILQVTEYLRDANHVSFFLPPVDEDYGDNVQVSTKFNQDRTMDLSSQDMSREHDLEVGGHSLLISNIDV